VLQLRLLPVTNGSGIGRAVTAELIGTAFLLAGVVGSGIMGDRLAGGNVAIARLANSVATGAVLFALIVTFGPVSGAHFNPAVTLATWSQGGLPKTAAAAYVAAQLTGAILGVIGAHLMFEEPVIAWSHHARRGAPQALSEAVATFGLLATVWGSARRSSVAPLAVAAYITSAYWFTASTSFANPAVTIARSMTDTFAGIRPQDVLPFIASQLFGAALATALFRRLAPALVSRPDAVVQPHSAGSD
jgi:glycerol uptake facilitator-like aquaporin